MSSKPHITFIIPGLFQPLKLWRQDFAFQPVAESLLALCASTRSESLPVTGLENTLFHLLGHPVDAGVPFAYYRYQLDFGAAPQQEVMCADPVLLQGGIDQVTLHPVLPVLSADEAADLLKLLNAHLAEDHLQLVAQHPQRWYLLGQGGHKPFPEQTTPLSQARGQNIFQLLPEGNRAYWHRLLNELQMLLHDRGAANAVWFWGEADPGRIASAPLQQGWQVPAITLTASMGAAAVQADAVNAADFRALASAETTVVVLENLLVAAVSDDTSQWQQALDHLEARWLLPALQAWQKGQCTISLTACDGRLLHCQQTPAWKFWQNRTVNWEQLAG